MNTIAIDCGASFIKAALIENEIIVKQTEKASPNLGAEFDYTNPVLIEQIVSNVADVIRELATGEECFVCISNEMHGFILANSDGTPYTDYISWQKEYGGISIDGKSSADILLSERYKNDIKKSGLFYRNGLPISNLLYLKRMNKLENGRLYFYTLGDYVLKRVFGIEPLCHVSNASATGIYDLIAGSWNEHILDLYGPEIVFPRIGNEVVGAVFEGIKYSILPAVGDYQAALLGAGIDDDKSVSFNLGTGAQVSIMTSAPNPAEGIQILPFFGGKFMKRIPHLPSGRAMNVYIRFFRSVADNLGVDCDDSQIWQAVLNSVKNADEDCSMSCSMSFFENPLDNDTKGKIESIGEYELTFANLSKCILQREADNFILAYYRLISKEEENKIEKIVFSGGIARKIEYIRQRIVESIDKQCDVIVAQNETLTGLYLYSRMFA